MMGSPAGDSDAKEREQPAHEVELEAFWIHRTPVTNEQYLAFIQATGHRPPDSADTGTPLWNGRTFPPDRARHPVTCVSWHDAQAYAQWAGLQLPTEAQWEYAARGPDAPTYPWGNTWDGAKLCWGENRGQTPVATLPVAGFPDGASWCGAFDMSGNVWEWVADWYDEHYYAQSPRLDPPGPPTAERKVGRGGSWDNAAKVNFRAAYRMYPLPDHRLHHVGFRCVLRLSH